MCKIYYSKVYDICVFDKCYTFYIRDCEVKKILALTLVLPAFFNIEDSCNLITLYVAYCLSWLGWDWLQYAHLYNCLVSSWSICFWRTEKFEVVEGGVSLRMAFEISELDTKVQELIFSLFFVLMKQDTNSSLLFHFHLPMVILFAITTVESNPWHHETLKWMLSFIICLDHGVLS